MPKLRNKDGGVSILAQVIAIICVIALVGASIYIIRKPAEKPAVREVHSLSISAQSPVTAGQSSAVTVGAYDDENNPMSGADISILAFAMKGGFGWDYEIELPLTDEGDGTYTSSLTSAWAGTYAVAATAWGTDVTASGKVTFVPGPVAEVVASSTSPRTASPSLISTITFYFADAHGNVVPPNQVEPLVGTSFGHLGEGRANPNNTFSIDLSSMDWGIAEVTITDNKSKVSGNLTVEFPPLYLTTEMDLTPPEINLISPEELEMQVTWPENMLSVRVDVFVPPTRGELNEYEMTIQYDNSILHLENVADADPADGFPTPEVEVLSGNSFKVGQKGYPPESFFDVFVMNFEGLAPGSGVLSITDVHLTEVVLYPIYDEKGMLVGYEEVPQLIPIPTGLENKSENVKTFERVIMPLKVWVFDNSGVSEDAAKKDAKEKAEEMYNKNAKECKSKYRYVFIVEVNHIPENEWRKKMGADNKLSFDEMDNIVKQENWGRWINIYYVPGCTLPDNALGWWTGNAIWIDDNKDFDNLTLAHELMHEFSKSRVKDSPADNAATQGGRRPGNIMNYDDTGESISEEQGRIIDEEIGRRTEDDLYRPYGPGPAPPP